MKPQKTTIIKNSEIERNWHELDASQFTLGRLASRVAVLLRGKHKVTFSPHQDGGDFVVVKNAEKVKFSRGAKLKDKVYYHFSGYPGGISAQTLARKMAEKPEQVIRAAVRGMIDDTRLRKNMLRRLKVVKGDKHDFPTPPPSSP